MVGNRARPAPVYSTRSGHFFGGAIADRFGAKPMIVTGMLMRAAGFATMGIAHEPWLLWFFPAFFPVSAVRFSTRRVQRWVVKLIRPEQRGRFFSLLMMQDSAGAVIGALLGSWLLQYDFRLVCATGAILFILCALFNAWLLPAWKLSTVRTPVREGMRRVMSDKRFVTYVLTLAGYYMLAVQVMLMLPIMVNDIAGSPAAVKWMYAIEACLSLTLLYPIARWSEKAFSAGASADGRLARHVAEHDPHRDGGQFTAAFYAYLRFLHRLGYRRTGARNAQRVARGREGAGKLYGL
ncbi:multidrug resistance protein MdtH [Salmonella enterica subsp. enterica]|uniref:Multidrug resistance protein MdtH n=1 Tax=Salmonella enterica I TaxID=59201 RepID=A0A447U514_SALET|nr:multidrug resistance protein MdtH [Salmonella enterica subsp. enterica]